MTRAVRDRPLVVFVDHVARLSGGEIALSRLLPALLDRVDVHVVLGEDGPLVARLQRSGISVEVLPLDPRVRDVRKDSVGTGPPLASVWRTLQHVMVLRARLRVLDADLVHTNSLKSAIYGGLAGRLAGVKVVWHVRDRIAADYLPWPAVLLVRLASHLLPSAIIANSQATLKTLPLARRSSIVYNPVVPDAVLPGAEEPVRRPGGALVVGVVGRLAEWKGQHVFLAAFAQGLGGTAHRARLVGSAMFGEDAYEQRLHELVRELGIEEQVEFRGFREDVHSEYAQLDVVVHCSILAEPFGQVVLEGMAAGLAVIAAAEGGPLEVVHDGQDGLLVPPSDVGALAAALARLVSEPETRERLGRAARTTAARYSPDRTAQGVVDVYATALPGWRPAEPTR